MAALLSAWRGVVGRRGMTSLVWGQMPTIVVPFRLGKTRLAPLPDELRSSLALAMLRDVVAAASAVAPVVVVTAAEVGDLDATVVADPGGGQGRAVATALKQVAPQRPALVVNADLPCATPRDLLTLAGSVPDDGVAVVAAGDGTTNALGLAAADRFAPLYGPGSAARFLALPNARALELPNLMDDVDTADDLARLEARLGPRTAEALAAVRAGAAR
jgi:2-phospho-L-lactate guanylyltransferase